MPLIKTASTIEWNFDKQGEGPVLVFIHGWGVDRRIWRQQIKHFAKSYQVISFDFPGHGQSSWKKVPLEVMARDVLGILKEMGVEKFTAIGSSLGGLLAIKIYEIAPEVFEHIVLVGSMPKFSKSDDYPFGLDIERMRKLDGQLESDYPAIVNIFFRSLFTKYERQSRRFKWIQRFRRDDTRIPVKTALVEYLDILETEDLRFVFKNIRVPVCSINGEGDTICDSETVKYLKANLPDAEFVVFEKCGHFPFLSKPDEFNKVLEEFLNQ